MTRPAGKRRVILLSVACAMNGVEVMNLTVAVPEVPTALLIKSASSALAVMLPTAGVFIYATRVVEIEVSIFKPVVPPTVARVAAVGLNVSPEHVTMTSPAMRLEPSVMITLFVATVAVVTTMDAGKVMPQ